MSVDGISVVLIFLRAFEKVLSRSTHLFFGRYENASFGVLLWLEERWKLFC